MNMFYQLARGSLLTYIASIMMKPYGKIVRLGDLIVIACPVSEIDITD